jgi:RecJ-like exonuclease
MGTITINGATYTGNSITMKGNKVIIDGKDVTPDSKEINVSIEGNLTKLEVDHVNTLSVKGTVLNISTKSGDVEVEGDVTGSIQTMSGDVNCGAVGGSISTMSGNVKHKKN